MFSLGFFTTYDSINQTLMTVHQENKMKPVKMLSTLVSVPKNSETSSLLILHPELSLS